MPRSPAAASLAFFFALVSLALSATNPLSAQRGERPPRFWVVQIERTTEKDDEGMLQWAKFDESARQNRCPQCNGKKKIECQTCERIEEFVDRGDCPECEHEPTKSRDDPNMATCWTCAGEGHVFDILEKAPCPSCQGRSILLCARCLGEGGFPQSNSDRMIRCTICKGTGMYRCRACRGKRHVDAIDLDDDLEDLEEQREELEELMKKIDSALSEKNGRDDAKTWKKLLARATREYKPLRDTMRTATEMAKDMASAPPAVAQEQMTADAFERQKHSILLYLATEKRLLDLAIARARHNEKVEESK